MEVVLDNAGLATSTTLRRQWKTADGPVHHVIDPSTGHSTSTRWTVATTIAGQAWWAEAMTKALLIGGPEAGKSTPWQLTDKDGSVLTGNGFETYRRIGVDHG